MSSFGSGPPSARTAATYPAVRASVAPDCPTASQRSAVRLREASTGITDGWIGSPSGVLRTSTETGCGAGRIVGSGPLWAARSALVDQGRRPQTVIHSHDMNGP